MIEIFAIYMFCKKLGVMLRNKGRSPVGMQFLLVALWFIGEFIGGFAAAVLAAIAWGNTGGGISPVAYIGALIGAICGATTVFIIAHYMQPRSDLILSHGFPIEKAAPAAVNPYANAGDGKR